MAEHPGGVAREDPGQAPPTGAEERVQRLEVDDAAVAVPGNSPRVDHVAEDGGGTVGQPCDQVVRGGGAVANVDPVGEQLQLRERPGPVGDVEGDIVLVPEPGVVAEERLPVLPRLDRPVAAVGSLASRDEEGEARPVVTTARTALREDAFGALLRRIVERELDLWDVRIRCQRIDCPRDEHLLSDPTLGERHEGSVARADVQMEVLGVAGDECRRERHIRSE